jgi:hypothetical protein
MKITFILLFCFYTATWLSGVYMSRFAKKESTIQKNSLFSFSYRLPSHYGLCSFGVHEFLIVRINGTVGPKSAFGLVACHTIKGRGLKNGHGL